MTITRTATRRFSPGTYNDGRPYAPARGRYAPREPLEDRQSPLHPVIDLPVEQPTPAAFLRVIIRELRIRFYQPKTVKLYGNALAALLRWFGAPPHKLTREDVRCYLELLVDGGGSASWVGGNLSAIRTAFDKMCGHQITLGLLSPRRPKRLPVVLSPEEVMRLLQAAPSLRDKLLLGLIYATGMRVSEVCRLRWRDFDFDRRVVNVWQGKGRTDRQVMLPISFEPLLRELSKAFGPEDFVFPSHNPRRHLSPRTAGRVMERARRIAGIGKVCSPHSLRHAFATHLFEHGTDIRYIQKLLGHAKLETTTIYTKVAVFRQQQIESPLDTLTAQAAKAPPRLPAERRPPVGRMQLKMIPRQGEPAADVKLTIVSEDRFIHLDGIVVRQPRLGWITLEVPPLEAWRQPLSWLTPDQRERVESPVFYETLRSELAKRYLAMMPSGQ